MPFLVCTRESGLVTEQSEFSAVESAQQLIKELREQGKVAFIRQVESDTSWYAREQQRFELGHYIETPWHNESWHSSHKNLFAHVSIEDTNRIAYTASNDHGMQDRQTRIKVGRYLNMVGCPNVNYWVSEFNRIYSNNEVKFAVTADEIQYVYENGPNSCMSHKANDYSSPCHPVRVYAYGDLQLAYIDDEGEITARCLVRPSEKTHCRIYGDESRLSSALAKLDYDENWESCLNGARLTRIETDNGSVVMPYLDAIGSAEYCGKHLVITSRGDIDCNNTDGVAGESYDECCHCGSRLDEYDSMHDEEGDSWCESCFSRYHNSCYSCDTYCHVDSGDGVTTESGEFYCDRCARRELSQCEDCSEYFLNDDISISDHDECYRCESCHEKHCDEQAELYTGELYDEEWNNMIGFPERIIVLGLPNIYTDPCYDIEFTWEKSYNQAILDNSAYDSKHMSIVYASIPMLPLYL